MAAPVDLQALFGAMGDAVVVADAAGAVILWNPAAERMFGFTAEEALGRRMDMIIPERLRKRHWEGYDHSMATGTTRYGHDVLRVPAVNKAGEPMSIAFTVCMLHDEAGRVTACASVIRDETARFNEDRALRKRLVELEAQLKAAAPPGSPSTPVGS